MKKLTLLPMLFATLTISTGAEASWSCLAFPRGMSSPRWNRLPAWGFGQNPSTAKEQAIKRCLRRNWWAHSCSINGCQQD